MTDIVTDSIEVFVKVLDSDSKPIKSTSIQVLNTNGLEETYYTDEKGFAGPIKLNCTDKYAMICIKDNYFEVNKKFADPCKLFTDKIIVFIMKSNVITH